MTTANQTRLSPAQRKFLDATAAAGPAGHPSPATGGRATVAAVSAWHRTATSLARAGLITIVSNGSMSRARLAAAQTFKRKSAKRKNMITVYAKLDCGCCTTELRFVDEKSATAAFGVVGFGNNMTITDDAGVAHTGLDTFYGFSTTEDEQEARSLGYLANLVSEKT